VLARSRKRRRLDKHPDPRLEVGPHPNYNTTYGKDILARLVACAPAHPQGKFEQVCRRCVSALFRVFLAHHHAFSFAFAPFLCFFFVLCFCFFFAFVVCACFDWRGAWCVPQSGQSGSGRVRAVELCIRRFRDVLHRPQRGTGDGVLHLVEGCIHGESAPRWCRCAVFFPFFPSSFSFLQPCAHLLRLCIVANIGAMCWLRLWNAMVECEHSVLQASQIAL